MSKHRGWWWRKVQQAKAAGREDGAKMIPSIEATEISDWESSLIQRYETVARERKTKFDKKDAPLKDQFTRVKEQFNTDKRHYDVKANERPLIRPISAWLAWVVILLIILTELPINRIIFSAITGESDILAFFLAFMASLFFAVCGHILGVHIRHGQWRSKIGAHVITGLVVVGSLLAMAYVRMYVFTDPSMGDRVSRWLIENMDLRAISALFLLLNLLLVIISGWLAYESHDPDQQYEQAHKRYQKTSKKLNRIIKRRAKVRASSVDDLGVYFDNCQELLHIYRRENLLARENTTLPAAWRNPEKQPDKLIGIEKFGFDLGDNSSAA